MKRQIRCPPCFNRGQTDIDGSLTVTEGKLDALIRTKVTQAQFSVDGEDTASTAQRQALGEEVRAEVAKAKKELEAKLRAELGPELESLTAREGALDQYRQQIEQQREALKGIGP